MWKKASNRNAKLYENVKETKNVKVFYRNMANNVFNVPRLFFIRFTLSSKISKKAESTQENREL